MKQNKTEIKTAIQGNVKDAINPKSITPAIVGSILDNIVDSYLDELQFSESEYNQLKALIYTNSISTFTMSSSTNERGILATLSLSYNILSKDDIFTSASINQGLGDVFANVNAGTKTISGGTSSQNKSFVLSLGYTRAGAPKTETKTAAHTTYVPQFKGFSNLTDFSTYAAMSSGLTKEVQASSAMTNLVSPISQYIWFVSNKSNATILDQNNFQQTIGNWNDGLSEFYKKVVEVTLTDGSRENLNLYRSREVKTLTGFTYKIQ